jgi:hypothetical protein
VCQIPGIYTFTFTTNSDNKIKEFDTTNNLRSFQVTCTNQDGSMPGEGNQDTGGGTGGDGQGGTGGSGGSRGGSCGPGGCNQDDEPGSGSGTGEPPVDVPKAGRCGAIDNLNIGAAMCTTFSGRSNKTNVLPGDLSSFTLYPLDTINCVDKKNPLTGRCDCCNFYRASPHRAELVLMGFDCDNGKLDCSIDFGDGTPIEK